MTNEIKSTQEEKETYIQDTLPRFEDTISKYKINRTLLIGIMMDMENKEDIYNMFVSLNVIRRFVHLATLFDSVEEKYIEWEKVFVEMLKSATNPLKLVQEVIKSVKSDYHCDLDSGGYCKGYDCKEIGKNINPFLAFCSLPSSGNFNLWIKEGGIVNSIEYRRLERPDIYGDEEPPSIDIDKLTNKTDVIMIGLFMDEYVNGGIGAKIIFQMERLKKHLQSGEEVETYKYLSSNFSFSNPPVVLPQPEVAYQPEETGTPAAGGPKITWNGKPADLATFIILFKEKGWITCPNAGETTATALLNCFDFKEHSPTKASLGKYFQKANGECYPTSWKNISPGKVQSAIGTPDKA